MSEHAASDVGLPTVADDVAIADGPEESDRDGGPNQQPIQQPIQQPPPPQQQRELGGSAFVAAHASAAGNFAGTDYAALGDAVSMLLTTTESTAHTLDAHTDTKPQFAIMHRDLMNIFSCLHLLSSEGPILARAAPLHDFDLSTPGNGYRSLLTIVAKAVHFLTDELKDVARDCLRVFFRAEAKSSTLHGLCGVLRTLTRLVTLAAKICENASPGHLFVTLPAGEMKNFLSEVEKMSREDFFGPCFGFQYGASATASIMKLVSTAMAGFSHGHNASDSSLKRGALSVFHTSLYLFRPEAKAQRIVETSQRGDIEFAKAFWNLLDTTAAKHIGKVVAPTVAWNVQLKIPISTDENLCGPVAAEMAVPRTWTSLGAGEVEAAARRLGSHLEVGAELPLGFEDEWVFRKMEEIAFVEARLISFRGFQGQVTSAALPRGAVRGQQMSPGLIVHIHGGGFVAQSSRSHEIYLRTWAKELNVPIFSIDYSLAPEAQYPDALMEVFYAYRWALKNHDRLGSTAERVVVTGDSAGGNLSMALTLLCVSRGVRVPDATLLAYPALELQFRASPARLLSVVDPLLPEGILKCCLKAYTGREKIEDLRIEDPFLSPMGAADRLLQGCKAVHIVAAEFDPLLDDAVAMASRLRDLGVPVTLKVFLGLSHGFLNFLGDAPIKLAQAYWLQKLRDALS